jgi:hypothetical protein
VPDRAGEGDQERLRGWSSWADLTSAGELLRSAWAYSPSGRVPDADLRISGTDEATERNAVGALDPDSSLARYRGLSDEEYRTALPGPTTPEDMKRWEKAVDERLGEVSAGDRAEAARLREQVLDRGLATETYRRLEPADALRMLA